MAFVTRLALLLLGLYVVRAGLQFVRSYRRTWPAGASWPTSASTSTSTCSASRLRFYEDKQTGQLMSRMVNDSDMFEKLIAHAIPDVLVNVLTLIGVSVGAVRHELAVGAAGDAADPADRAGDAQLCAVRAPGLPRATAGAGPAQRHAERQPLRHPRDQGVHAGGTRGAAHREAHPPLPRLAAACAAADGDLRAVRRLRLLARHGRRDLLRRPAGLPADACPSRISWRSSSTWSCSTSPCASSAARGRASRRRWRAATGSRSCWTRSRRWRRPRGRSRCRGGRAARWRSRT